MNVKGIFPKWILTRIFRGGSALLNIFIYFDGTPNKALVYSVGKKQSRVLKQWITGYIRECEIKLR